MSGKKKKPPSGSINIGRSERNIASNASGGGSREDDKRALNGQNWEAWKFKQAEHQKRIQRRIERMQERGGGYGGYGGFGGFGGYGYGGMGGMFGGYDAAQDAAEIAQIEAAAKQIEAQNQQHQTSLADLDPGLLESLDKDTLLRFAFSPEDMAALDLNGEHDAIADVRSVLTVNNPTKELMSYLAESGQFTDVVWSGHGSEEGMWITNEEGQSELLPAKEMANMFKDTSVQEMLLNVCDGGAQVDDALNRVGIDTFAYEREINDTEAIEDAVDFAEAGSLDAVSTLTHYSFKDGKLSSKKGGRLQKGLETLATHIGPEAFAHISPFLGLGLHSGFAGLGNLNLDPEALAAISKAATPAAPNIAAPKVPTPAAPVIPSIAGLGSGIQGPVAPPVNTVSSKGASSLGNVAKQVANTGTAHAAARETPPVRGRARAGLNYSRNIR